MSRKKTMAKQESQIEEVLDFCAGLARRMMVSGANLERVYYALGRICHAYGLREVSIFLLSSHIMLSARDAQGRYASRQKSIPPIAIHLERLKSLNRLSYRVTAETPRSSELAGMLEQASAVRDYPDWMILIAQICAMTCLCLIFGGRLREAAAVAVITALMHYVMRLLEKPGLDRIVTNALTMWTATTATLLMIRVTGGSGSVILITLSMLVIPGIPLVNAVRNLLCGNEMNGILQTFKVTVETLALAMGIYIAVFLFDGTAFHSVVVTPLTNPAALIVLSFAASFSFGIVFRIPPHDLWHAALGGMLTRIALLLLTPVIPNRLLYMTLSALVAALYAELLATRRRDPSTYFVYPSIIPLIPGDLFYYSLVGIYLGDQGMSVENGRSCLLALLGLSIGFVLSSIIAHYVRKMRHNRLVEASLSKWKI